MDEIRDPFGLIRSILLLSNSNLPLPKKIESITNYISNSFSSEIFNFIPFEEISKEGILDRILREKEAFFVDNGFEVDSKEFLPEEQHLKKPSFAFIPIYDESSPLGVLYIGFSKEIKFSLLTKDILKLIAKEIERNLRTERLVEKVDRYLSELGALYEIGKAVTSTIKLEELMNLILFTGQRILKVKGGVLRIKDRDSEELKIQCRSGDFLPIILEERISKRVFSMKTPQYVHHRPRGKSSVFILCVPLITSNGTVLGTLSYYNHEVKKSKNYERELQLLMTMAEHISRAIENAYLYKTLEELNQRLKETQTLLLHKEKISALRELTNTIAHEIKNPLTSIGGFARRLDRLLSEENSNKRYIETIIKEVTRLEKILNEILHYTHKDSTKFSECDIKTIIRESLSMVLSGLSNNGIKVIEEFESNLPKINGDQEQLKYAFFHLIENAFHAMNGKGTLSLRAFPLIFNESYYVRIEVEDSGKGIEPEILHHIFNPFYTNKKSSLGLGLPIVHKIITSHYGRIEVENHSGKGTNFIITLPVLQGINYG